MGTDFKERTSPYGDWRDDIEPHLLHLGNSQFASPMCPEHGWIGMRKKKISVWACNMCEYTVKINEPIYREWRNKMKLKSNKINRG